ncbi:hypothetical protein TNCV_2510241 [Trichonephila clavipes]|nr:hypothetical protein TNCV_2510241 [Trichonephila clavipes]
MLMVPQRVRVLDEVKQPGFRCDVGERDRLAKEGSENERATGVSFTYQELYSNERSKLNLIQRTPPMHQWYTGTSSSSPLEIKRDGVSQTVLANLTSGHLKCLSYGSGRKIHTICKKGWDHLASPGHIREGITIIDFLVANNLLEII